MQNTLYAITVVLDVIILENVNLTTERTVIAKDRRNKHVHIQLKCPS